MEIGDFVRKLDGTPFDIHVTPDWYPPPTIARIRNREDHKVWVEYCSGWFSAERLEVVGAPQYVLKS